MMFASPSFVDILRMMHGDISLCLLLITLVVGTTVLIRLTVYGTAHREVQQSDELTASRLHLYGWVTALLACITVFFIYRLVSLTVQNHAPRSDINTAPVYEQMNSHR